MKKQKKILIQIITFLVILLSGCKVFAADISSYFEEMQFSEEYQKYLELSDKEKENVIAPRMYNIPKNEIITANPVKLARILGSTVLSKYSLRTIIPENMVIKNQQQTNSCWTFSSLSTLESNLALRDYKMGYSPVVYDFSERHMEYATSQSFLDNAENKNGFARKVGQGGNSLLFVPYLTNGTGAIAEEDMEFENNEDLIDISEIQDKNVITQVNDMIDFPSYPSKEFSSPEDKIQIMQQMKDHIKNYGAIDAGIHGSQDSSIYNNETGALFCNNSASYRINHAVSIVGWDDTFSKEKFADGNQPQNDGAWIIKNSWGTEAERHNLDEMKAIIIQDFPDKCAEEGWTDVTQISDEGAKEFFISLGYIIDEENDEAVMKLGDDGFMYISYEDANIYMMLTGVVDAQTESTYENIYQYDQYGGILPIKWKTSKIYLATVFDKMTDTSEYLNQVSINAAERYTCKVYVNPNGPSKAMEDLQPVELEAGETETFDAGYHTIEFKKPIKINGESFAVVLEVQGTQANLISVMMEFNYRQKFGNDGSIGYIYDKVEVESGRCFWATEAGMSDNKWNDTSTTSSMTKGGWPDFDTTIKAFTTSNVLESIEVANPPSQIEYIEGEDFNPAGMVINSRYGNGNLVEVSASDYMIKDGENLKVGQDTVTIEYEEKVATQEITVKPNSVTELRIIQGPVKEEYVVGQKFDSTGMIVEATYLNGLVKNVEDFTVKDGDSLLDGQTVVTIEYGGKSATQEVTVVKKVATAISIKKNPTKLKYIKDEDKLDLTGGILEVSYNDDTNADIPMTSTEIVVGGFDNEELGKKTIILTYQEKNVQFDIEIIEKAKPENSNFDNMQGDVTRVRAYYFTDASKKEYTIINVELSGIAKAGQNESMEYYYYLSPNQKETDITNWVKISDLQNEGDKMFFEINTTDISNYEEVSTADSLYLYVKEVATRNEMKAETVTAPKLLEVDNIDIEEYVDGEKKAEVDSGTITDSAPGDKDDATIAPGPIPNAGKRIIAICFVIAVVVITVVFIRYKDIEVK